MQLSSLLGDDITAPTAAADIQITGLGADSREIKPGFVFAALPGQKADGAQFINQAIGRGASAVLVGEGTKLDAGKLTVPVLRAKNARRAFAMMAARFYGRQPPVVIAVTGTSGKTSVVEFTRQILSSLGYQTASLGTIGIIKPDGSTMGSLTTPDPVALHKILFDLAEEGVSHLALEASSHGLKQHRLDGVDLTAGAFTNLGRDHLDYHPDIEDYMHAKMRLFRELLQPGKVAVINVYGAHAEVALEVARKRDLLCYTVGTHGDCLKLQHVELEGFSQRLTLSVKGRPVNVLLPLVGAYQVENALTAAGLAIALTGDNDGVVNALQNLQGVKGRLDIVGVARGGLAVIDYAHKPEALRAALAAVRPFVSGRLICVFGCGGDRDRGKRPIMGAIGAKMCDTVIITDDNPRTEDAASIRAEIRTGAPQSLEIASRGDAIAHAIGMMGQGDVVIVAGKGHETGQIVGDVVLPFSDFDVVSKALAAISSGV